MQANPAWAACFAFVAMAVAVFILLARHERAYRSRVPRRRERRRPSPRPVRERKAEPPIWTRPPPRRLGAPPPTGTFAVGAEGEARVAAVLRGAGLNALNGKYLETSGGYVQFDHVARVGAALVVIETKNWAGRLAGAGRSPNWERTQPWGAVDHFGSPVLQVQAQERRLREFLGPGNCEVTHLVVLAGSAEPPRGAPRCVIHLRDLAGRLRDIEARGGDAVAARVAYARIAAAIDRTPQVQAAQAHGMDHERWRAGRDGRRKGDAEGSRP